MALSCLAGANWSENIYLGVTLSRQRQVVDLKAITFEQEQQLLGRRYRTGFCRENYSATIKVSPQPPLSATSKAAVQLEGPLSTESYPS